MSDATTRPEGCALVTGSSVVSVTREEIAFPKQLYQTLAASDLTTWVSTPSFAQRLRKLSPGRSWPMAVT